MKFLADMGISLETVAWLREQGHGAVHLMDRGAQQAQDPDILKWTRDEERVLRVHDLDFSELVVALVECEEEPPHVHNLSTLREQTGSPVEEAESNETDGLIQLYIGARYPGERGRLPVDAYLERT